MASTNSLRVMVIVELPPRDEFTKSATTKCPLSFEMRVTRSTLLSNHTLVAAEVAGHNPALGQSV